MNSLLSRSAWGERTELARSASPLKACGLAIVLATGDGALGLWKALEEVSPTTRTNAVPCIRPPTSSTDAQFRAAGSQVRPARDLGSPDRATAQAAVASFAKKYRTKYAKAAPARSRSATRS